MMLDGHELYKQKAEVHNSCCVLQCRSKIRPLFGFPNPNKYWDRFWEWVRVVANPKHESMSADCIWRTQDVCYKHFVSEDFVGRKNKLRKTAVPSVNLPPPNQKSFSAIIDHPANQTDLPITNELDHHAFDFEELLENVRPIKFLLNESIDDHNENLHKCYKIFRRNATEENVSENTAVSIFRRAAIKEITSENTAAFDSNDFSEPLNSIKTKIDENASAIASTGKNTSNSLLLLWPSSYDNSPGDDSSIIKVPDENEKPHFAALKTFSLATCTNHEICRLCFRSLRQEDVIKLHDKLKKKIKVILPEVDLDLYTNSVICVQCKKKLYLSYQFKQTSMTTEENIKSIIEKNKETKRPNLDLFVVTRSLVGETVVEYFSEKSSIGFDHDYDLIPAITYELEDVKSKLWESNEDNQKLQNKNVTLLHNGLNVTTDKPKQKYNRITRNTLKGSESFVCEKCGFFTKSSDSFGRHLRQHRQNKWPEGFPTKGGRPKKPKIWKCNRCTKVFVQHDRLILHSREHQTPHICRICNKQFNLQFYLRTHIKYVHLKEYNYRQCHLCGKKFSPRGLHAHLQMHNPTKFYKCDFCPKKFIRLIGLKKHVRCRHTEFVPLSCQFCGKTVKYKESLNKHIQLFHMNQGENICDVCNKPYWKKADLLKHKIRMHGGYTTNKENREG